MQTYVDKVENQVIRESMLAERRRWEAIGASPSIGAESEDMADALGHWAEDDCLARPDRPGDELFLKQIAGEDPEIVEQRLAARHINNHYMVQSAKDFAKLDKELPPEETPLDLSSPDARLQTLDNLTQNRAGNMMGEHTCVASSLVGAAILAGGESGTDGLLALMKAMEQNAAEDMLESTRKNLGPLREKIEKGETLTLADMHQLQTNLYSELKTTQNRQGGDAEKDGINPATVKAFLANSDDMGNLMKENGLAVSFINNNGMVNSHHAVLEIGRGEGAAPAIYDPYFRDEGQIITSDEETAEYRRVQTGRAG